MSYFREEKSSRVDDFLLKNDEAILKKFSLSLHLGGRLNSARLSYYEHVEVHEGDHTLKTENPESECSLCTFPRIIIFFKQG